MRRDSPSKTDAYFAPAFCLRNSLASPDSGTFSSPVRSGRMETRQVVTMISHSPAVATRCGSSICRYVPYRLLVPMSTQQSVYCGGALDSPKINRIASIRVFTSHGVPDCKLQTEYSDLRITVWTTGIATCMHENAPRFHSAARHNPRDVYPLFPQ